MKKVPAPIPSDLDIQPGDPLNRLIGLSDGIYAFAMTLLAVNVDLPQLADTASNLEVTQAVIALAPQLFVYITSFLLIGLYWQIARRTFSMITRGDTTLVWLTLLQLMCVAFLPVATGLFDTHPSVPIVVVAYAATLLIIGVVGQVLWWYAQRAHLLDESVNPHLIRYYAFRGYTTSIVYLLLLLVGIFDPSNARLVLLLLLFSPLQQTFYRLWQRVRHPNETNG